MRQSYMPSLVAPRVLIDNLFPILPQQSTRYDVKAKVERNHLVLPAARFLASQLPVPAYSESEWTTWTQPEGNVYFSRSLTFRSVTDCDTREESTRQTIETWTSFLTGLAEAKGFRLSCDVELYLRVEADECYYYFADFATRCIFWLDAYDTSDLGLGPVVSESHSRLQLQSQFWAHVEYFPMHFGGLKTSDVDELRAIFTHALVDNITSPTSTFPYDTKQCQQFSSILNASRDQAHDGRIVAVVARLWHTISYNRYESHFGESQARLDRTTSILEQNDKELAFTRSIAKFISLGNTTYFQRKLDGMFVDNLVYGHDWEAFMIGSQKQWQRAAVQSAAVIVGSVTLSAVCSATLPTFLPGIMAVLSILSALVLSRRHNAMEESGATGGHEYLQSVRSERFGFQCLAFSFATPAILSQISLLVLLFQFFIFFTSSLGYYPALAAISFVSAFLFLIHHATTSSIGLFQALSINRAKAEIELA